MNLIEQVQFAFNNVKANTRIMPKRSSALGDIIADAIIQDEGTIWGHSVEGATVESTAFYIDDRLKNLEGLDDNIISGANEFAGVVDRFISSLRSDVNPAIESFTKVLTDSMDAYDSSLDDWVSEIKIQLIDIPDPVADFPDMFNLEDNKGIAFPKGWEISKSFDPLNDVTTQDDILAMITTNSGALDKSTHAWLGSADSKELIEAHRVAFGLPCSTEDLKALFARGTPLRNLDMACFIYMYADKLAREPSPAATGVRAEDYIRSVKILRNIAAGQLSRGIAALKATLKTETLVAGRADKRLTVIKPIYDMYLAKGGTTQSLMGSLMNNSTRTSLKSMIENIFSDTADYDTLVKLRRQKSKTSRSSTMRTLAYNTFVGMSTTSSMTDMEDKYSRGNLEGFRKITIENAREVCAGLTDSETMSVNTVALIVITRSRFFYTTAEKYLTSMIDIKTGNPDLTVDEVRFMATMKYVASFLSTMVVVEKTPY